LPNTIVSVTTRYGTHFDFKIDAKKDEGGSPSKQELLLDNETIFQPFKTLMTSFRTTDQTQHLRTPSFAGYFTILLARVAVTAFQLALLLLPDFLLMEYFLGNKQM